MSRFSGRQYRGAQRVLKEIKCEEAEQRQAEHDARMKALLPVIEVHGEIVSLAEVEVEEVVNPGPATPGLVQRNRKVRGVQKSNRHVK